MYVKLKMIQYIVSDTLRYGILVEVLFSLTYCFSGAFGAASHLMKKIPTIKISLNESRLKIEPYSICYSLDMPMVIVK